MQRGFGGMKPETFFTFFGVLVILGGVLFIYLGIRMLIEVAKP
jgi:hypothetical protein